MWGRNRERIEQLERKVDRLLDKLESLASAPPPQSNAAETFAKLLGTTMQSQADLVGSLGDIAVRSVARRNGIKGGTRNVQTAQRDRAGKFIPKSRRIAADKPRCELCTNPLYPHVTIEMIQAHRAHTREGEQVGNNNPERTDQSTDERADDGRQDANPADRNGGPLN